MGFDTVAIARGTDKDQRGRGYGDRLVLSMSIESEDTLAFSALSGVRPRIETMPLERAGEAYARMMSGDARFRMVLTVG
jgi:D-arabinose 1-dehydrogenase-like Zn-dependent alcohol dehydrogenase